MTDSQKLEALKALGDSFRDNPLATYSDDSLAKELKKRGWWVTEPLDLELSKLDTILAIDCPDLAGR